MFDSKIADAARMVVLNRADSVSILQRKMEIGFARAARLMDQLERVGVAGKDNGSRTRAILMDESQIEALIERIESGSLDDKQSIRADPEIAKLRREIMEIVDEKIDKYIQKRVAK